MSTARYRVSSRGDYYGTSSKTLVIDGPTDQSDRRAGYCFPTVEISPGAAIPFMFTVTNGADVTNSWKKSYAIVNVKTKKIVSRNFIKDGTEKSIVAPYGIAVNPVTRAISSLPMPGTTLTPGNDIMLLSPQA